jgi:dipeptidyl aminopeptidase/acylaminoacyl peptidase
MHAQQKTPYSVHPHNTSSSVPLADLFGYAPFNKPRFSPCHTYYSYLAPTEHGAPTLWIEPVDRSCPARPLIPSQDRPLTNFIWLYTSKHIIFIRDTQGNEKWQLFVYNLTTGITTPLTASAPHSRVIPFFSLSPKHPTHIVFQWNARKESVYDLYRYCVETHELICLEQNPGNVFNWHVDSNLELRAYTTFSHDNTVALYTRATPSHRWHHQLTWLPENNWGSHVLFFSPCSTYLYFVDTQSTNTHLLQRIDLSTHTVESLFKDDTYDIYHESDITQVLDKMPPPHTTLWAQDGTLLGFSYTKNRLAWHFFQDTTPYKKLIDFLTNPYFESWVDHTDSHTYILGRCSDTEPPSFWRYDVASKAITFLGSTRPALNAYSFGHTQSITTQTPDGLTIHGYLTMPASPSPSGTFPLILKIHGGPWSRDIFGFSSEIQMLASNGYACLQVNYRGSTGYGKAFSLASKKQLGTTMVDDVICMTRYALKKFPLDPHRMAYMGRSYGGFSALSAGWRYQQLFKAIIAQVPATSLRFFLDLYPKHWETAQYHFRERIGHPEKEATLLDEQSPITHAFKAKKPLFISYGTNDSRVPPEHIHGYVANMDTSVPHEILCFEDEGHFNHKQENLLKHWSAVMRFIQKYV